MLKWTKLLHVYFVLSKIVKSKSLECYTEDDYGITNVSCTADLYYYENCTNDFLSRHYKDLYGQNYWPDKPHNLELIPTSEVYANKWTLPGFLITNTPPRTVSIQIIRGFQIDFQEVEDTNKTKCIIILIQNTTLDHQDRDNNLKFLVQLGRLPGPKNYVFTSWSLPKAPHSEKDECQIRHGRTGKYGWVLSNGSKDWLTTISYYNNIEDKYIRVWFISAPEQYGFIKYTVTLTKIISGEGTSLEHREEVHTNTISQTDYTFLDVKPGRYRVLVQPFDDQRNSLHDCKCKTNQGQCGESCVATITAVIIVPEEVTFITVQSLSRDDTNKQQYILPIVIACVFIILLSITTIGCYKFQFNRGGFRTNEEVQLDVLSETQVKQGHLERKNVQVLLTDNDDEHVKVVKALVSMLQEVTTLQVVLTIPQQAEDWMGGQTDHVVVALSDSAVRLYSDWAAHGYPEGGTMFMTRLKSALDHPQIYPPKTFSITLFPHTQYLPMPLDFLNKSVFNIPADLYDFIHHIEGTKDLNSTDEVMATEYNNLHHAMDEALRRIERQSSADSGYGGSGREKETDLEYVSDFIPPSPSLSRNSLPNSLNIHVQIEQINENTEF